MICHHAKGGDQRPLGTARGCNGRPVSAELLHITSAVTASINPCKCDAVPTTDLFCRILGSGEMREPCVLRRNGKLLGWILK